MLRVWNAYYQRAICEKVSRGCIWKIRKLSPIWRRHFKCEENSIVFLCIWWWWFIHTVTWWLIFLRVSHTRNQSIRDFVVFLWHTYHGFNSLKLVIMRIISRTVQTTTHVSVSDFWSKNPTYLDLLFGPSSLLSGDRVGWAISFLS